MAKQNNIQIITSYIPIKESEIIWNNLENKIKHIMSYSKEYPNPIWWRSRHGQSQQKNDVHFDKVIFQYDHDLKIGLVDYNENCTV